MFFSTGNGYASQLSNIPVNGRNPPTALEEAAVHMAINDDGSLRVVDFFMPWEKQALDGADKDLGTTPLELLPSEFSCGNIKRIGVVTGKSGKTYWIDMDNMGGYRNGPGQLDNVIQWYQNENSVYAGAGVYPLEGGYVYISVIQYPTHVFKFSCDSGVPSFNLVADSPENNAYVLGVGHGTTTTLDGQPGTGLLWTSDVEGANLRIYDAIPVTGKLRLRNSFVTPGVTKFSRPVFGDGIVYQGTTLGSIYAYGSPVNVPLNCTALQFGTVNIKATSSPLTVQCKASTALTVTAVNLSGNPNFLLSDLPSLPYQVAQGQNFSFLASFTPQSVGPLSSAIVVNTTQQTQGFSINTQVQLRGTGQSQAALLQLAPNTVTFNGFITGQDESGANQSVTITNLGNSMLQLNTIQFSTFSETGPWITPSGTAAVRSVGAFTFYNLPSTISANTGLTVRINFNPLRSGSYAAFVKFTTNGGTKLLNVLATGNDVPKALVEFELPNGGWAPFSNGTAFSFGNVTQNTSRYLRLRVTNIGGTNAAALSFTVSKPPFGIPGSIVGASNQVDLGEGTLINAGQNATAALYCSVPKSQINVDSYNGTAVWAMNLNDPSFGRQQLQFVCNAVSEQLGPSNPGSQRATYRYAGCFKENDPGRQLQTQIYSSETNNTNDICVAQCAAQGYIFAATQYRSQCWCGYNRPKTLVDEANCNFACTGDNNQVCGGNGVSGNGALLSAFGDVTRWNGNSTDVPGPYINPGAFGFKSWGCYTEATNARALSMGVSSNNTVRGCLDACSGYAYAGVEYGGQCYCGQSLAAGSVSAPARDCNMACNNNQTEFCGGPDRLNIYSFNNATPSGMTNPTTTTSALATSSLPFVSTTSLTSTTSTTGPPKPAITAGGFRYVDCFTEPGSSRALVDKASADSRMTADLCASLCVGYAFMATEYSSECYCGNTLQAGSVKATDGRCSMTCSGNPINICGGPNGLSLYQFAVQNASSSITTSTTSTSRAMSSTLSSVSSVSAGSSVSKATTRNTTSSVSLLTSTSNRPLNATTSSIGIMSMTSLLTSSSSSLISISSTPLISPASTVTNSAMTTVTSSLSRSPTTVAVSTLNGTFSITTSFTSTGSTTVLNTTSSRTAASSLSSSITIPSSLIATSGLATSLSTASMSRSSVLTSSSIFTSIFPSRSASTSAAVMSTTAAQSSATSRTSPSSSTSNSPITVSTQPSSSVSSSTVSTRAATTSATINPSSKVTSSSASFPATSSSSAIATPSSLPYQTLGCHAEPSSGGRLLNGASTSSSSMTPALCATFCATKSLAIFGLEYGRECYCASSLPASSPPALSPNSSSIPAGCSMACAGSSSDICGGPSRLSVYNNTAFAAPTHKPLFDGGFAFKGCYTDVGPRALGGHGFSSANMTQELCVGACRERGWRVAGAEYAEQCFCGDQVAASADGNGGVKVGDGECAMRCKGDGGEWCGGASRLSVWGIV